MSGNLRLLPSTVGMDLEPRTLLRLAEQENLKTVFIFGYDDRDEEYLAASSADGGELLWLMERCRQMLMRIADDY